MHAFDEQARQSTVSSARTAGNSRPSSRGGAGSTTTAQGVDDNDNIKARPKYTSWVFHIVANNERTGGHLASSSQRRTAPGENLCLPQLPVTWHKADVLRACGITQLLDAALAGFNVTIMTYGQTGSGKTFTMSGREDVLEMDDYNGDTDDGVVTRSVAYLYEVLQKRGSSTRLRASYCEIYNEALYDLQRWTKQQLPVRWDPAKGFHVPDLFVKDCPAMSDMLNVISRGMRHRRMGSHELNMESSRSHSIMTVYCDTPASPAGDDAYPGASLASMGKISFVDLAGSERVKDTKTSNGMLKEAGSINKSLFALGKVISALADNGGGPGGAAHVPYRDSKLTRLLMDSLGGSALALMIACCSPSAATAEETLSTLSYATRAKNIRNRPVMQVDPQEALVASLKREVQLLRAENAYFRNQIALSTKVGGTPTETSTPSSGSPRHSRQGSFAEGGPHAAVESGEGTAWPTGPSTAAVDSGAKPGDAPGIHPRAGEGRAAETERRLAEAQAMISQFAAENARLAAASEAAASRRALVDSDYKNALDEVDWLKSRLESLEAAILAHGSDPEEPPQPPSKPTTPEPATPASNNLPADSATSLREVLPVVPVMVGYDVAEQDTVAGKSTSPREDPPELTLTSSHGRAGGVVPPGASHISSALTHGAVHAEVSISAGEEASSNIDDEEEDELASSSTDGEELASSSTDDEELVSSSNGDD
ncbi:probable Kinesin-like protein KIF17 at N-terminal half [Coccomyxa sp. Obi]|nr:probable Kinesin-like protein KIF17 at N-terminal half [Coccomyxa sp. Obi]